MSEALLFLMKFLLIAGLISTGPGRVSGRETEQVRTITSSGSGYLQRNSDLIRFSGTGENMRTTLPAVILVKREILPYMPV